MKLIIVAAGQGSRLRPLTDHQPKCMVPFQGKPIIDYTLDVADQIGIQDIVLVTGYKSEILKQHLKGRKTRFYHNPRFDCTNMLYSLFCAEEEMKDQDIIISYADIIYSKSILQALAEEPANASVVVDKGWETLWRFRMEDPLQDAETMKLDKLGNIIELGKKPQSYSEVEGQYIGLIKIKASVLSKITGFYHELSKTSMYQEEEFDNLYMTDFIQMIIDQVLPVKAVLIDKGWVEVDSVQDLQVYEKPEVLEKLKVFQ